MAGETLDSPVDDLIDAATSGAADQSPPTDPSTTSSDRSLGRNVSFSRLNAQAPEFVPRSSNRAGDLHPPPPVAIPPPPVAVMHVYPLPNSPFHLPPPPNHGSYQYVCGYGEREAVHGPADPEPPPPPMRNGLSDELAQKIVNQVSTSFLIFFLCGNFVLNCVLLQYFGIDRLL